VSAVRRWASPILLALSFALMLLATITSFGAPSRADPADRASHLVFSVALLAFPIVGVVLLKRLPENAIGWVFSIGGLTWSLQRSSEVYVQGYVVEGHASGQFAELVVWILAWTSPIAYGMTATFLLLLFPTGHLASARWRPVARLASASLGLLVVATAIGRNELDDFPTLMTPYGFGGTTADVLDALRGIAWLLLILSVLLAAASVVARWRSSTGVQRQQMKWMAFAAALLLISSLSWAVSEELASPLSGVAIIALPVALGIAILRHRLYDIDVIINRTLVYAVMTGLLGAAYGAIAIGGSTLFGESSVTIAGATLAVAGLFRPLRGRVQAFIDRRFYRTKYDAAQTIAEFNARIREDRDLESLLHELAMVAGRSMQPSFVSVWLTTREREGTLWSRGDGDGGRLRPGSDRGRAAIRAGRSHPSPSEGVKNPNAKNGI
jgi:hypothetical protein